MLHIRIGMILVLAGPAHSGEIHGWTDAQGRRHFGDEPPANVQTVVLQPQPNVVEMAPVPRIPTVSAPRARASKGLGSEDSKRLEELEREIRFFELSTIGHESKRAERLRALRHERAVLLKKAR